MEERRGQLNKNKTGTRRNNELKNDERKYKLEKETDRRTGNKPEQQETRNRKTTG